MVPPLSAEQAARCYDAFLVDTLSRLTGLGPRTVLVGASRPWPRLEELSGRFSLTLESQGDGDLGRRLERTMTREIERGAPVVVVGTDTPDLPPALVTRAFALLSREEIVFGPAYDGGYYLVGLRERVAPVFSLGRSWGGASVLSQSLVRSGQAGMSAALLPWWPDVDDHAALVRLARRLRAVHGSRRPSATAELLAELSDEGIEL